MNFPPYRSVLTYIARGGFCDTSVSSLSSNEYFWVHRLSENVVFFNIDKPLPRAQYILCIVYPGIIVFGLS